MEPPAPLCAVHKQFLNVEVVDAAPLRKLVRNQVAQAKKEVKMKALIEKVTD